MEDYFNFLYNYLYYQQPQNPIYQSPLNSNPQNNNMNLYNLFNCIYYPNNYQLLCNLFNNHNIPNSFQQINIGNTYHQVNYNVGKEQNNFQNSNSNLFLNNKNTVNYNSNIPNNFSLNNIQLYQNNNINNVNHINLQKENIESKEEKKNENIIIEEKDNLLNKKRELIEKEKEIKIEENNNLDEIDDDYETTEKKQKRNRRRKRKSKKQVNNVKKENNKKLENEKPTINMNLRNRLSNKNQNSNNDPNNINIIDENTENILLQNLDQHLNDTFFDFVNNKKHTKKYRELKYINTNNKEEFMSLNFYKKMKEKFIPRTKTNVKICDIIPQFNEHSINCNDSVFSSYNYKKFLEVNKDLKVKDVLNNIEKIWPKNLINYFDDRVLNFISLCNYNVDLAIEHIKNKTREFLTFVDEINKQNTNIESIVKIIHPLPNNKQEKEKNKRKSY